METFPGSTPHKAEKGPEKILSSEEVLQALSEYAEGFTVSRELSDEKGVYFTEVQVKGEKEGEMDEYQYTRKGKAVNQYVQTVISVIHYVDDVPVGGSDIASYDEVTGTWTQS